MSIELAEAHYCMTAAQARLDQSKERVLDCLWALAHVGEDLTRLMPRPIWELSWLSRCQQADQQSAIQAREAFFRMRDG